MLGNVTGVDAASKHVFVDADDKVGIRISYDYMIPATGATHSYFGHDEFAAFTPGLKSLPDAESRRNQLLEAFEKAEIEDDSDRRKALVTVLSKRAPVANLALYLLRYFNNGPVFGLPGTDSRGFRYQTQSSGDWGGLRTDLARYGLLFGSLLNERISGSSVR